MVSLIYILHYSAWHLKVFMSKTLHSDNGYHPYLKAKVLGTLYLSLLKGQRTQTVHMHMHAYTQ